MRAPTIHLGPATRQRLLLAAKILIAALAVFALLGFFAAPAVVKTYVANKLGDEIGRKLEFGEVQVNPFALSATLRNISLYEADRQDKMLTVGEIYLNASAASLLRLAPVVAEIRIEQPSARIVRSSENRFNFSDIVDKLLAQPASESSAHFSLHNIHLRGGRIDYDDQWRQSRHSLSEIDLALPFLSNLKRGVDIFTKPAFSARLDGSPLAISGQTRPFAATHDTALQIDLDGLSLPQFMALAPIPLNFKLESGLLDTRLNLDFHQTGETGSMVVTGHAALRQVQVQEKSGAPLLQWERLALDLERVEPFNKLVRLASLKLEAPVLHASRRQDGSLNLLQAFSPPPTASGTAPAAKPMVLALAQAEITGAQVQWRDAAAGPASAALNVKKLDATLTDFSSDGSKEAHLKATLETDAAETLHYDATLAADGKSLQGQAQIAALRPQRLRPYFATAFSGDLGATLLDATLPHRLAWPASGLELTLQQASAHLRNLQVTLPQEKSPSIAAREVALTGLQLDLGKQSVSAEQLAVDGARLAASRNRQGEIDLLTLFAAHTDQAAHDATPAAHQAPAKPVRGWQAALKHLKLEQSDLSFSRRTGGGAKQRQAGAAATRQAGSGARQYRAAVGGGGRRPCGADSALAKSYLQPARQSERAGYAQPATARRQPADRRPAPRHHRIPAVFRRSQQRHLQQRRPERPRQADAAVAGTSAAGTESQLHRFAQPDRSAHPRPHHRRRLRALEVARDRQRRRPVQHAEKSAHAGARRCRPLGLLRAHHRQPERPPEPAGHRRQSGGGAGGADHQPDPGCAEAGGSGRRTRGAGQGPRTADPGRPDHAAGRQHQFFR